MSTEPRYVLDASAALALLFDEVGAGQVEGCLSQCVMSVLNWGEVIQICIDRGAKVGQIESEFPRGLSEIYPLSIEDVTAAAKMWLPTKSLGLSLADRVCLTLAGRLGLTALTSDRAWTEVNDVKVELIR